MTEVLSLFYPKLPPTSNHIYVMGTKLKDPARQYKAEFRQWMAQTNGPLLQQLPDKDNPNTLFALSLTFGLNCINQSWGDVALPKSRRAKERFKKLDLTNRIKFMEDCIRDALDIDDSKTFMAWQRKYHSETEGVWFSLYTIDPGDVGVPVVT